MSSPTHKESLMRRIFAKLFGPSKREKEATEKIVACIRRKRRARSLAASGTAFLALVSCAAPASDQGQGGSTGATPMVVVNIGTGGGITTTNTSAPTAAPASSASAAQTATNDTKPAVGTDAIKAAVPTASAVDAAVKTLTGEGTTVPPKPDAEPLPAPAVPE